MMPKDKLQQQMDKFYERYQVIEGSEHTDISESSISVKKILQDMTDETLKKHSDSIEAYKLIIDSTAQLCHELNIKDSMSVFVVFNYLLWNGYFSKDKDYIYTIGGRTSLMGHFGTDIMNGKGVCLNKSHMLSGLLNIMNYESHMVFNKVSGKFTDNYRPCIERKIKKYYQLPMKIGAFLLNPITNIIGNHACALVKKDDVYYAYDPTNLLVFKLDSFLKADVIGGTGSIDIKPYSLSWFCDLDDKKIVEIVKSYEKVKSEVQPHDIDTIKASFETNLELCRNSTRLFNDFHDENEANRRRVLKIFNK